MNKTTLGKKKNKLSLGEFVWNGFNYTTGISFIGICGSLANYKQGGVNQQLGLNVIWILFIEGLIAGSVAWAFAKLSRIYKSSNNGGAYIFVRGTFGKFVGILVAFMTYVCMPFTITYQIMILIRGSFAPQFVGSEGWWALHWGNFGDLYFDLIGAAIFATSSLIIFKGIKIYKKFTMSTSFIKWGTASFLILVAIVMACTNGERNYALWARGDATHSIPKLQMNSVVQCFNTCFFFFGGFEVFSTAGKNVHNSKRNVGIGVIMVMAIATIFYTLVMVVFFGAIDPFGETGGFHQNEIMSFWFIKGLRDIKFLYWLGPSLMIINSLALKVNLSMQNSLYGGTAFHPLAVEGYFPSGLSKLNKDNIPIKASTLNIGIVITFIAVWLLFPDLVKGIICSTEGIHPYPFSPSDKNYYHDAFNVGNMAQGSATIKIFIYACVVSAILTVSVKHREFRLKIYEEMIFAFALIFLSFLFVYHYYNLVSTAIDGFNAHNSGVIIGTMLELGFIIMSVSFCTIWYHTYYKHVYKIRYLKNPKIQIALDKEFGLVGH